jgi:transcription antitermination factor NusA-like protein
MSRDDKVDPVGACVGHRGSRVQAVVNELYDEKIDIVRWNQDTAIFIGEALSPAKAVKVQVNEEQKSAFVIVPDNQLSLAIGKSGQNVRLAARLTGWRIDIRSEAQVARAALMAMTSALGVDDETTEDEAVEAAPAAETNGYLAETPAPEDEIGVEARNGGSLEAPEAALPLSHSETIEEVEETGEKSSPA